MTAELEVRIREKKFQVNCSQEEYERLKPAVDYLNEQLAEIANATKTINTERIAVMAALNLAYELLSVNLSEGFDLVTFQRRMKTMTSKLDELLTHQETLFK